MAYSAAQIESFRNELSTLRTALTTLQSGRLPINVTIDGDIVQRHLVNVPLLTSRIAQLEDILFEHDYPGQHVTSLKIHSGKGL